jgi:type IV secretory pathway VirB4 component
MKQKQIILGRQQGCLPFFHTEKLTEAELNHHVHIVGASGYGKTVLLSHIIKQTIEQGRGLLFIDLKGDIETVLRFSQFAIDAGRESDLQLFSLSNQKLSLPYNVVEGGTATQLRDKIMSSLTWSEEYYKHLSASFLLKLLLGLVHLREVKHKNFGLSDIYKLCSEVQAVEDLFLELSGSRPAPTAQVQRALEDCVEFLKQNDNFKSLQGLRSQLESLVLSDFGEMISTGAGGINFFDSVQSNKITYMFLDSRRYGESSKAVGRFILQDLKSTSSRIDSEIPQAERQPFTVIVDEFADLAQEDFIGFLDRARSSRMSVVVAHQELSDLRRISPEFAARLTGNTSTLYAFLQKNGESAEMISSMAGTSTVWKSTKQTERFGFFEIDSGKGSKREVEEFNIHPNMIKSLGVGECVCIKKFPRARSYVVNVARGN